MLFDQKITRKEQVEDLKIRYQNAVNVMKIVAHRTWKSKPQTLTRN